MSFSPAAGDPGLPPPGRRASPARSTGSRFDTDASSDARWDEDDQRWHRRRTDRGDGRRRAPLITGAGGLSEPKLPEIDGIETFQGEVFHSARWDHDVDLTGKRVAVIGTGASGDPDRPRDRSTASATSTSTSAPRRTSCRATTARYTPAREARCSGTCRGLQRAYRTGIYWGREAYVPGLHAGSPKLAAPGQGAGAGQHRARASPTRTLRARVTPDFQIGCKRILISNTYYPALAADHVDLVTDPIAKVTGDAIVTADGVERPDRRAHRRDRLPHHRAADRRAHPRPRRAHARRRVGARRAWRPTRAPRSAASPTSSRSSAPTPGSGTRQHGVHDRVAGRLHPSTRSRTMRAPRRRRRRAAAEAAQDEWNARPPATDAAHRLEHRRLRELVPRRPRQATPPCGRARPSPSAGCSPLRRRRLRRRARRPRRTVTEGATHAHEDPRRTRSSSSPEPAPASAASSPLDCRPAGRPAGPLRRRRGRSRPRPSTCVKAAGAARGAQRPSRRRRPRRRRGRTPPTWSSSSAGSTCVVNNAGVALAGDFDDLTYDDIDWIVGRQLLGRRPRHQGVPAPPDRLRRRRTWSTSPRSSA